MFVLVVIYPSKFQTSDCLRSSLSPALLTEAGAWGGLASSWLAHEGPR
jgi:hypothetical protein